jgi:hypothetical protein
LDEKPDKLRLQRKGRAHRDVPLHKNKNLLRQVVGFRHPDANDAESRSGFRVPWTRNPTIGNCLEKAGHIEMCPYKKKQNPLRQVVGFRDLTRMVGSKGAAVGCAPRTCVDFQRIGKIDEDFFYIDRCSISGDYYWGIVLLYFKATPGF